MGFLRIAYKVKVILENPTLQWRFKQLGHIYKDDNQKIALVLFQMNYVVRENMLVKDTRNCNIFY